MTRLCLRFLQVAHALSIVTAVEAAIPPEVAAMNQQQHQQANAAKPAAYGSSAMKTQLRFTASVEIPLIAVLCLVSPHLATLLVVKLNHPLPFITAATYSKCKEEICQRFSG